MATLMSAHVLREPRGVFELVEGIELSDPQPGEVLVRHNRRDSNHTNQPSRLYWSQPKGR